MTGVLLKTDNEPKRGAVCLGLCVLRTMTAGGLSRCLVTAAPTGSRDHGIGSPGGHRVKRLAGVETKGGKVFLLKNANLNPTAAGKLASARIPDAITWTNQMTHRFPCSLVPLFSSFPPLLSGYTSAVSVGGVYFSHVRVA